MKEFPAWFVLALAVLIGLFSTIITAIVVDGYRDCKYIEAGYTQKMLPGHSWPVWVKEAPKWAGPR
jgi:hypothetical protein